MLVNSLSLSKNKADSLSSLYAQINGRENPLSESVTEVFSRVAESSQKAIAVRHNGRQITYQELDKRSNQLANLIVSLNLPQESIVALLTDKSIEMIVSLVSISKSGCAVLPINTVEPIKRITLMLKEAGVKLLIYCSRYISEARSLAKNCQLDCCFCLDPEFSDLDVMERTHKADVFIEVESSKTVYLDSSALATISTECPPISILPSTLFSLIFTSGSTGVPKGVLIDHKAIVRLVKNTNYLQVSEHDCFAQTVNISFDPSFLEIFGALLNGACLCLVDPELLLDSIKLKGYMEENDVSLMVLITPIFHEHAAIHPQLFSDLKMLIIGGDALNPVIANTIHEMFPTLQIVNAYGPTENCVISTCHLVKGINSTVPIGKPITNSQIYVVDSSHNLLGPGLAGEILVGGIGLSRGYLNDIELTADKFIRNPFGEGLVYKTGDLGRLRGDGSIEFIGRKDDQIKLHGYRIELNEVSHEVSNYFNGAQSLVLARQNPVEQIELVAYIKSPKLKSDEEVRTAIGRILPSHMVPSYLVYILDFPLSATGKINRALLPQPDWNQIQNQDSAGGISMNESKMLEVWKEVLGKSQIGVNDNFFNIGGNSLLVIKLISEVEKTMQAKIGVGDVFDHPTVRKLCAKAFNEVNETTANVNYYDL